MKTAFFVMGPESSGTRMLTKAFCTLGIYGDYKHKQRMDNLDFSNTPDIIVIRRSLPHGDSWPPVGELVNLLKRAGYGVVIPVMILRDKDSTASSQIRHAHAKNQPEAKGSIQYAVDHAYKELASVGLAPHIISYEPFVKYEGVRKAFFRQFGLSEPIMSFYDANEKYQGDE